MTAGLSLPIRVAFGGPPSCSSAASASGNGRRSLAVYLEVLGAYLATYNYLYIYIHIHIFICVCDMCLCVCLCLFCALQSLHAYQSLKDEQPLC